MSGGDVSENETVRFAAGAATAAFEFGGSSDRGSVRRINEDSFLARPPVFVVADGMGGHSHGDRASQTAIAVFSRRFGDAAPARPDDVLAAIREANDDVLALAGSGESLSGTTLAGVAFVAVSPAGGYHWMAFNVGDSRVYRWDGRSLTQLSVDHSVVQELVDAGVLSRGEAERHPDRNVVTRALGADSDVDPDIWLLPADGRQTFLICSDGLTKELSDDEIARIIVFHATLSLGDELAMSLSERLVRAAVAAGGSDNVTAVVVEADVANIRADPTADDGADDDTIDRRGVSRHLEDTSPRR
ncbi:PP2C family protein-serine/threonine phosphatase [Marisediminicola sp. LYQ134]|uniref:PP2C family protein-serine/threonine phosphatase n=1 Tax=unclassified Marisediminicola TaxID=2618316 RepID=UPI003983A15D